MRGDTAPRQQAALLDGAVMLRAPKGYCIDGDSLHPDSPAFALIASCGPTKRQADPDVYPMVVTVSGIAHAGALPEADAVAALMAPARVLEAINGDGLTLVHVHGGGPTAARSDAPGPRAGDDPRHWRAVMQVNGHLLSLALFAPEGSPLADRAGLAVIGALAEDIRIANAVRTAAPPDTGNAATTGGKGLRGLFGRLSLAGKTR